MLCFPSTGGSIATMCKSCSLQANDPFLERGESVGKLSRGVCVSFHLVDECDSIGDDVIATLLDFSTAVFSSGNNTLKTASFSHSFLFPPAYFFSFASCFFFSVAAFSTSSAFFCAVDGAVVSVKDPPLL